MFQTWKTSGEVPLAVAGPADGPVMSEVVVSTACISGHGIPLLVTCSHRLMVPFTWARLVRPKESGLDAAISPSCNGRRRHVQFESSQAIDLVIARTKRGLSENHQQLEAYSVHVNPTTSLFPPVFSLMSLLLCLIISVFKYFIRTSHHLPVERENIAPGSWQQLPLSMAGDARERSSTDLA